MHLHRTKFNSHGSIRDEIVERLDARIDWVGWRRRFDRQIRPFKNRSRGELYTSNCQWDFWNFLDIHFEYLTLVLYNAKESRHSIAEKWLDYYFPFVLSLSPRALNLLLVPIFSWFRNKIYSEGLPVRK